MTVSTLPASISRISRCKAGRSNVPPLYPPSSYLSSSASQPSWRWLSM
jgi:hypothetical protein